MSDVLFIKTSSLGDVIHHMPALTEARAKRPDARFAWVVEEAFAPLVRLHPAVADVIPVAGRRWRRAPIAGFDLAGDRQVYARASQSRAMTPMIDTQGLFLKSALIARAARGRRHGYDPNSIKEPFACMLYDVRHRGGMEAARDRAKPRIDRRWRWATRRMARRISASTARRWPSLQSGPTACCCTRLRVPTRNGRRRTGGCLRPCWERTSIWWCRSAPRPNANARRGSPRRHRARGCRTARRSMQLARLMAGAAFVVGVDTGLLHLAAALGVPLIAIFSASEPGLTGPDGRRRDPCAGRQGLSAIGRRGGRGRRVA